MGLRRKKERQYFLALDIGTEFVKALVFQIIEAKAIVFGFGQAKLSKRLVSAKEAITLACAMAKLKPEQLILTGAGGLIKGSNNKIDLFRPNFKEKINHSELKNILQKSQWKALERIKAQQGENVKIELISANLNSFQVDGYPVQNPLGLTGKEIAVEIFNTYTSLQKLPFLENLISDLGFLQAEIVFQPYALSSLIKHSDTNSNIVIIDIGGKITEISIIRKGIFNGSKTFVLGSRVFTGRLEQKLGLDFPQAEEIKIKYCQGKVSADMAEKIRTILKDDLAIWLSAVKLVLEKTNFFVNEILLCGQGSNLPGLNKGIEKIRLIKTKDFDWLIDKTNKLKGAGYVPSISLISLMLSLRNQKDIMTQILGQTIRMIKNQ